MDPIASASLKYSRIKPSLPLPLAARARTQTRSRHTCTQTANTAAAASTNIRTPSTTRRSELNRLPLGPFPRFAPPLLRLPQHPLVRPPGKRRRVPQIARQRGAVLLRGFHVVRPKGLGLDADEPKQLVRDGRVAAPARRGELLVEVDALCLLEEEEVVEFGVEGLEPDSRRLRGGAGWGGGDFERGDVDCWEG